MTQIDDEAGQLERAHADDGQQELVLADAASGVASTVGLFLQDPMVFALGAIAVFAGTIGKRKAEERLAAMHSAAIARLGSELKADIAGIRKRLEGPEAEEALNAACQGAIRAAGVEKAKMIGAVLGAAASTASPNWNEAAEFIRDVEQFTNDDLRALQLLWRVQRGAYHAESRSGRSMSLVPDQYRQTWVDVMRLAKADRISDDDWFARCGRLGGFGLTVPVNQAVVSGGKGNYCFRLTTRAVRFLSALGYNTDPAAVSEGPLRPRRKAGDGCRRGRASRADG